MAKEKTTKKEAEDKENHLLALKKKFNNNVYEISVPTNEEGTEFAVGYIRKPSRVELAPIIPQLTSNPLGAMEILLNTVWIEGDERLKTEDELFFGAVNCMEEIVKFRMGVLKKI